MSCQTLPIPFVDPAMRVTPRRPVARLAAARLAAARRDVACCDEAQGDVITNLFVDQYSCVIDTPSSPAARARDRARRMVEDALDRAEARALPHLTNFWHADPGSSHMPQCSKLQPDHDTLALRAALCAQPDIAPDAPVTTAERNRLRLAVHAMNTTLTIAYPPVGAVVVTYSFLRGESVRLTTRSLVFIGGLMGLMHGQLPGI